MEDRCRDVLAGKLRDEPVDRRPCRPDPFAGWQHRAVVQVDHVVVVARRRLPGRRAACRTLGDPVVALVVIAVSMAMRVGLAMRVAREMDVRPIGMARKVGMGGVLMRHRGAAEEQLGEHAEHQQQSHRAEV